ncbi:hypothetical protein HGRIS_006836 [Hohenbuehelia grisea]|uniref:Uncharacterized protein n=1 Tax=Hohenbuehelia grisea TaxID=104357 RepID=A0ABR3JA68_9AGAR
MAGASSLAIVGMSNASIDFLCDLYDALTVIALFLVLLSEASVSELANDDNGQSGLQPPVRPSRIPSLVRTNNSEVSPTFWQDLLEKAEYWERKKAEEEARLKGVSTRLDQKREYLANFDRRVVNLQDHAAKQRAEAIQLQEDLALRKADLARRKGKLDDWQADLSAHNKFTRDNAFKNFSERLLHLASTKQKDDAHSVLRAEYARLTDKHSKLRSTHADLEAKYWDLDAKHWDLDAKHSDLDSKHSEQSSLLQTLRTAAIGTLGNHSQMLHEMNQLKIDNIHKEGMVRDFVGDILGELAEARQEIQALKASLGKESQALKASLGKESQAHQELQALKASQVEEREARAKERDQYEQEIREIHWDYIQHNRKLTREMEQLRLAQEAYVMQQGISSDFEDVLLRRIREAKAMNRARDEQTEQAEPIPVPGSPTLSDMSCDDSLYGGILEVSDLSLSLDSDCSSSTLPTSIQSLTSPPATKLPTKFAFDFEASPPSACGAGSPSTFASNAAAAATKRAPKTRQCILSTSFRFICSPVHETGSKREAFDDRLRASKRVKLSSLKDLDEESSIAGVSAGFVFGFEAERFVLGTGMPGVSGTSAAAPSTTRAPRTRCCSSTPAAFRFAMPPIREKNSGRSAKRVKVDFGEF